MSRFYVGQRVVCVDDTGIPAYAIGYVVRGQEYTVTGVYECHGCGRHSLMVGHVDPMPEVPGMCGCVTIGGHPYGELSYNPARFQPMDTLEDTMERLESEGAPVELEKQTV